MKKLIKCIIIIILLKNYCLCNETITLAVASNFLYTAKIISKNFKIKNDFKIIISSDSTTNLFTKIKNNAPFDIFFSADKKHIKILEKLNLYRNKSYTYAIGKITLFKKHEKVKKQILKKIKKEKNIALSSFKLSPYGNSSNKMLINLKILHKNMIFGANINQTFSFIENNTCNTGIIALSQINKNKNNMYWKIPKYLYPEIKQVLFLVKNKKDKMNEKFLNEIKKKHYKNIIKLQGYK